MRFVLKMTVRETRASWRRLLLFFACIAVGVAAIVVLRSVIQSVRRVFDAEARTLIAADVILTATREWPPATLDTINRRLEEAGATARTETIETPTMARPSDETRQVAKMVELRAIQPAFPLYGTLTLADGRPYSHDLLKDHGALVRPELLTSLGVAVGDRIVLGEATFAIRGVIAGEPGRGVGQFNLGPRVLVDFDDVPSTGLLGFGGRARRELLVRVPEPQIQPLVRALRRDLRQQFVNARSYRANEDQIGRDFERAENYLSLVGLIIVILGGIAVSSVTRVFILQKMRAIAVLKCVGASSRQVMAVYILQVLLLAAAGSLLGIGLAQGVVGAIPLALKGSEGTSILADATYTVTASAAAQGLVVGVLVSLLFAVVPLLGVRQIKPSLLLRDEARAPSWDWVRMATMVFAAAALVGVASWQASSWRIGAVVCAGFAVLAALLYLAGLALVSMTAPFASARGFAVRHGLLHLTRPGNQTRTILLAVGLGAFFIVGVRSLQDNLLRELTVQVAANAPDMFLMDIQKAQADGVRSFLADPAHGTSQAQLIPVLRARVVGVAGHKTTLETVEDVRRRGSLGREYTITYRDHLEANERLVEGRFWSGSSPEPEVSIEESVHERFGIDVGDTIRFDVLGRVIAARVTSVRDVEWRTSRNGGFMFLFRPGVLEQAPQTFVAPVKGPNEPAARARLQHDVVTAFPNVSVIDFHEVLETVRGVMSKVTLAISVVGGLVLFSGVMILVGAVAMTKFQRVYESAIFKTLGATTATVGRMLLVEYAVLGLVAGIVGSLGAIALTWGVSRYALEIPWRVFPWEHVGGVLVTTGLVAAIGVLSSLDVLRNKPLGTLRSE